MTAAFQPASSPFATEATPAGADFLPLKGTDHVEFYVGNARQAAYFYRAAFGMSLVAYAGPETGQRDRASYVVQQGKIRFVLTTPLRSGDAVADHVHRHGDAVRVIALWVDDARSAWQETTQPRRQSAWPHPRSCPTSTVRSSSRASAPMATRFTPLSSAATTPGRFFPAFAPSIDDPVARPVGLLHIDHMVGNVGWHEMDEWVNFYRAT